MLQLYCQNNVKIVHRKNQLVCAIHLIVRSLCPIISHHPSRFVAQNFCPSSSFPSCDSCSSRWKNGKGEWRHLRDRKQPRSPVHGGPCSGCSAEMCVCSLLWVARKNWQAAVKQLTAILNRGVSFHQEEWVNFTHSFSLVVFQCMISAVWCSKQPVFSLLQGGAKKRSDWLWREQVKLIILHCSVRWSSSTWVLVNCLF